MTDSNRILEWPNINHDFDSTENEIEEINLGLNKNDIDALLHEIEFEFPRVANRLTLVIGTPEFEIEMNNLIFCGSDNKKVNNNTQGFPRHILALLLKVSNLHTEKYGHFLDQSPNWKYV